mmetsp:Transcript_17882/g.35280  ORF Transcript_17882/g.35280 Transcript_17882/m.35280 type:complete len:344 (+) Transcript_17882:38-1069(+)
MPGTNIDRGIVERLHGDQAHWGNTMLSTTEEHVVLDDYQNLVNERELRQAPVQVHIALQRRVDDEESAAENEHVQEARVCHHFDRSSDIAVAKVVNERNQNELITEALSMPSPAPIIEVQNAGGYQSPTTNKLTVDNSVSLADAYLLTIILGIVGAHQFYLGRIKWGLLYTLTLGFLGWGVLIDLIRMPELVASREKHLSEYGHNNFFFEPQGSLGRLTDSYVLWAFGFLGIHQFYLGRPRMGLIYLCSFGLLGMYVFDLFRMPSLVKESRERYRIDEAYMCLLPGGILGLHHFYLGDWRRGFLYLFTFGFLGLGVVVDLFRLPHLVKQAQMRQSGANEVLNL